MKNASKTHVPKYSAHVCIPGLVQGILCRSANAGVMATRIEAGSLLVPFDTSLSYPIFAKSWHDSLHPIFARRTLLAAVVPSTVLTSTLCAVNWG